MLPLAIHLLNVALLVLKGNTPEESVSNPNQTHLILLINILQDGLETFRQVR